MTGGGSRVRVLRMTTNATKAAGRVIAAAVSGRRVLVAPEVRERRLDVCRACDENPRGRCMKCLCIVSRKTRLATESCPMGKWGIDTPSPTTDEPDDHPTSSELA